MMRLRGGDPRARIEQKIRREDGHWLWVGALDSSGYGSFWLDGRVESAHRAVYRLAFGEIADDMEVDHICRQPACVRPSHLREATHAENMRNTDRANRDECLNGHSFDAVNTHFVSGRRQCRACNAAAVRRYKARRASSGGAA